MMDTLEKEAFVPPVVNSWREAPAPPSREQTNFAVALCRTELAYAERVATIQTFDAMDRREMSDLIDRLIVLRQARFKRLRRRGRR